MSKYPVPGTSGCSVYSMHLQGYVSAAGIVFSFQFTSCMSRNRLLSCIRDLVSDLQGFEGTQCRHRSCSRSDVYRFSYLFMKAVCTMWHSPPILTHVLMTDQAQRFVLLLWEKETTSDQDFNNLCIYKNNKPVLLHQWKISKISSEQQLLIRQLLSEWKNKK